MVQTFNPRAQETETNRSLLVRGQAVLHSESRLARVTQQYPISKSQYIYIFFFGVPELSVHVEIRSWQWVFSIMYHQFNEQALSLNPEFYSLRARVPWGIPTSAQAGHTTLGIQTPISSLAQQAPDLPSHLCSPLNGCLYKPGQKPHTEKNYSFPENFTGSKAKSLMLRAVLGRMVYRTHSVKEGLSINSQVMKEQHTWAL